MVVYKYPLERMVPLPTGAHVLSVGVQDSRSRPVVYALVDPARPPKMRAFTLLATGEHIAEQPGRFVGTVVLQPQSPGGRDLLPHGYVLHVFVEDE